MTQDQSGGVTPSDVRTTPMVAAGVVPYSSAGAPPEQVTLGELAIECTEGCELLERLDTLGDRTQPERVRQIDDRAADRVAVAVRARGRRRTSPRS